MAKILLADDERAVSESSALWLQSNDGHTTEIVDDGEEALFRLRTYSYDLVILDWNMPKLTGVEVCRTYRQSGGKVPVLILTGKSAINEKEVGFDAGADDYLTKPFDLKELSMRVRALLRRPTNLVGESFSVGPIRVDTRTRQAFKDDQQVELTQREYLLLEFLMKNAGKVMTPVEILNEVWPAESEVSPGIIKTLVGRLRSKLSENASESVIQNIHGRGYCVREPQA